MLVRATKKDVKWKGARKESIIAKGRTLGGLLVEEQAYGGRATQKKKDAARICADQNQMCWDPMPK